MQKKNVQAPIKSHQNDTRRSSCPASKDKPKKKDFLTYHKNGSAQISRTLGEKVKRTSEALSEREANHLYSEIQKAHTNLPKPEEHPTLQDEGEGYHSDITPRSQEIEHEQLEQNFQDIPPIPHEEQTGTTKPQSMQSKSVERSSKIFTESDEEKEDDRETEKKPDVEYPMDIRIEDLPTELERFSHNRIPSTQGGRTFNIDQAPLTGPDLNASHSSKSTVLLAESPRGSGGKSREHQMTQETEGSADTKEPEIQESFDIKPPKSLTTEATRVIDNVVAHDGPLIQPKPQEVTHANSMSMKNKINLEIYLKVENLLYVIKENIMSGKPIFQFCRDYIEVAPKIDRENFEKILTTEQERKLVKSSFIVKRLGIILMLYFTVENKPNEKAMFQLKSLINSIHQNFIIVGYLISLKLKDKTKANVWTARLMELLEHDSSANFTKNENLDKLAYNNTNICNIMKNLIVSMRNKEILYAFNSIVIQLDRISIKEAYTRLLKSFSVFMSEKELRSQVTQYAPKKPVPESKVQQLLKVEKEKKKDELAFLPKLVKGGVESQYTLVVDLDETLVHYAELPGKLNELRVRPYVAHFLTEVSKYYEIVVFTAAMQEYADWVLDNIDKEHCVTHRLYRQHASPDGYNFVKDLSKLGRDMARIMIVDNLAENFRLQPDNGIYIKPWYDDPEDTALLELTPLLVEIARKKVTDVRVALRRFRDQMIENIEKGFENPHLNLQLD